MQVYRLFSNPNICGMWSKIKYRKWKVYNLFAEDIPLYVAGGEKVHEFSGLRSKVTIKLSIKLFETFLSISE